MSQIEQKQQSADILATLGMDENGRSRTWTRRIVWILVAAAVIAVAAYAVWGRRGKEDGPRYVTNPARIGDLVETVSATGTLAALDTVQVGSETSGRILEVLVDFNDRVEKGRVLATIDPEQARSRADEAAAQLQAARASLARAEATVAESAQNLARLRSLRDSGLISAQDFDTAQATARRSQADVASARAQVTVAQASLAEARTNLGRTSIRSPISGIVLSRAVEPGQTVAASFQTPVLFTIARDLTAMSLHVQVDEADVGKVKEGQRSSFTVDAYPDRRFDAQLVSLRNVAVTAQNVVTYEAVLAVDNTDLRLRPGMTATATIVTSKKEGVLLVPNAALRFTPPDVTAAGQPRRSGLFLPGISRGGFPGGSRQRQQQSNRTTGNGARPADRPAAGSATVWVLRDGKPVAVPVTPGATDGRDTVVSSAQLETGDEVIVDVAVEEGKTS
jgi:HlyD family secretion protein